MRRWTSWIVLGGALAVPATSAGCGSSNDFDTLFDSPAADGGGEGGGATSEGGTSQATPDAGADPARRLACGTSVCTVPAELCCISRGDNGAAKCVAGSTCPSTGSDVSSIACASTANCPGGVCCARKLDNGVNVQCRPACAQGETQVCDPNAASSGCPAGTACSRKNASDANLPSGLGTCGGN